MTNYIGLNDLKMNHYYNSILKVGVVGGEGGSLLTSITERVEEPTVSATVPSGSYSSGAKKPPGTNDSSKKHKPPKVRGFLM